MSSPNKQLHDKGITSIDASVVFYGAVLPTLRLSK